MPLLSPTENELADMEARATLKAGTNKALIDNYLFAELFNRDTGFYSWKKRKPVWKFENGEWIRYRTRLRRREWIEMFMRIQTKSGKIVPLILNQEQRQLECMVLRMERAGLPVRMTLCKARQIGGSTYIEAVAFYEMMTGKETKVLLVGDNGDRARMLLEIAGVARTNMPKSMDVETQEITPWKFKMRSKATYTLSWDEPLMSQIRVASAEEDEPGQGGTRKIVHLSESASGTYTQSKIGNILPSLPTLPGTYGFNESTPNGGTGWFYEVFMSSWKERDRSLIERQHPWVAMFFPSWAHAEYQWTLTYGAGRELSDAQKREINRTLNADEEWILKQTYFRRWSQSDDWVPVSMPSGEVKWSRVGIGKQRVSLDHIAWRRSKINDVEIHGDMNLMNQEYGKDPESCFLASGRPVFDREILMEMIRTTTDPWIGDIDVALDQDGRSLAQPGGRTGWEWNVTG